MKTNSRFLFAASLVLALALTFGCSDNGGDTINGNGQGGNNHQVVADLTITTAEQLIEFASLVNRGNYFKDKIVRLGANIMLNDTTNWQNWANNPPDNEWVSMGSQPSSGCFDGTFDGNGYVISGIYINGYGYYIGLFKCLGAEGTIKNLGVTASYVKSETDMVGGLVGYNYYGTISNTYFIGVVKGVGNVGGLVGYHHGGVISNSYSIGVVEGSGAVGGLVGNIVGGTIKNSYSAVAVTGEGGGLVGSDIVSNTREITGSYYDKEKSGKSDTGKGVGKTTMEMKQQSTFVGWDFNGTWGINSKINNGYPYLQVSKYEIGNNLSSGGGTLPSSSSLPQSSSSLGNSSSSSGGNSVSSSSRGECGVSSSSFIYEVSDLFVKSGDCINHTAEICYSPEGESETPWELCGDQVAGYLEFYLLERCGNDEYPLTIDNPNCAAMGSPGELRCFGGVRVSMSTGQVKADFFSISGLLGTWDLYVKIVKDKDPNGYIEPVKVCSFPTFEYWEE